MIYTHSRERTLRDEKIEILLLKALIVLIIDLISKLLENNS